MDYAPPVYDEAAGMIMEPSPEVQRRSNLGPMRTGGSRGGPGMAGDRYVALGADEEMADTATIQTQRANEIALRRQRENAAAFQRQMVQEEEYAKSSYRQSSRDHEIAARLAAGNDESMAMSAIQQSQKDAELALQLQREMNGGDASSFASARPVRKQKVVRVLVPTGAKPGDSLAVATPTTGKFEIRVPTWAAPGQHFDCHVTTIIQVSPAGRRPNDAQAPGYQPPSLDPPLPTGWERGMTPDGTPFYVDHNTRTTHWQAPTPAQATPAPSYDNQSAPPPPQNPANMTEEEMIAAAIALSLKESQQQQAEQSQEPTVPPPTPEDDDENAPVAEALPLHQPDFLDTTATPATGE